MKVVIPGPSPGKSIRNPFVEELLHLIFEKQKIALDLQYFEQHISQARALREISEDNNIDLTWSVTSIKRETELLPIRIPIYRGLIGWRIFLIRKDEQHIFDTIKTKNDLSKYIGVQRFDWTDFSVLKANELLVEGNFSFEQLSRAISGGVADYFPRSVLEIGKEIDREINKDLSIEKKILIKYPSADFFFVSKNNTKLQEIIKLGFEQALVDGTYMELFQRHFGDSLVKLSLDSRTIIELNNPYFPQRSSKINRKYWHKL